MANRIYSYTGWDGIKIYKNTESEQKLVQTFIALYNMAKTEQESRTEANPKNLEMWRKAYLGVLNALTQDGEESKRKSRQLRKVIYELVESKVDNSIPMPKMTPRYKSDLPLVYITESYLKYEMDNILTKSINDKSERSTYVDGTTWYKVWWDSLDNTYERSGNCKIELRTVDQIVPQPGVTDYHQLEYIFEKQTVSSTRLYDLYNRKIDSNDATGNVDIISCYYLNEHRIVGLFTWAAKSGQVICNEKDWQIRKIRKCRICDTVNPIGETCRNCGSQSFKFVNADVDILDDDLYVISNPYTEKDESGQEQQKVTRELFATKGTEIPFYRVSQLPFVPRPAVSSLDSIYGVSEVFIHLEMQDGVNKALTKAMDKTLKSGAVVTKPERMKLGEKDESFKIFGVRSAEEAQMVQTKQIAADTSQDIMLAGLLYESARASSGVTESYQGKADNTATSGVAKQAQIAQSAGRIESLRVMKANAFAGIYELMLKYLLAFSDEPRSFVKVLPDGQSEELSWNKYLFLDKDKYGNIYYRDDFTFNSDPAATLSQNRVSMWQETNDKFVMGAFGNAADPRTLKLYWNTLSQLQYPLSKTVIAGINDNEQHIPYEIEQYLLQNPEVMQQITQMAKTGSGQGGARPNSGPAGNGKTHAANVENTNLKNSALNKNIIESAQQTAGLK